MKGNVAIASATDVLVDGATDTLIPTPAGKSTNGDAVLKLKLSNNKLSPKYTSTLAAAASAEL